MALSIRADCVFWGKLCFIVFAIFSSPHMIATVPSFLYLFSRHPPPPIPKIAQEEALHPGSGLLFTVIPERPFCHYHSQAVEAAYRVFGAEYGRNGIGCGKGSLPDFHS